MEVLPQFPKYRRVSNVFPERYGQLADGESSSNVLFTQATFLSCKEKESFRALIARVLVRGEFHERKINCFSFSDEIDYFQVVKNNQGGFNEILGSFLLTKQRKQFKMINDNEFSDDDVNISLKISTSSFSD